MRKARLIALLSIVALVLGAGTALSASREELVVPHYPDVQEGEMYNRDDIWKPISFDSFTPRPGARVAIPQGMYKETTTGPISISSGRVPAAGSALVEGRGGSVYTASQVADREIKRMIRQLH
ncbi:MAG: hypothetical protein GY716_09955 [bacterium]|nr:hypothetical protein [bacterium]